MSKAATATNKENRVAKYLRETRAELRKVTWPSPEEARNLTVIVLVVTVIMSILLGLLDTIFTALMAFIIA